MFGIIIVSVLSSILVNFDIFNDALVPLLFIVPLVSLSEISQKKKNLFLVLGNMILGFYYIQNLGQSLQYLFLILIEIITLISMLDMSTNRLKAKVVIHKFVFRLINIVGLFCLSLLVGSREHEVFQVPLLILLIIQYVYSSRGISQFKFFQQEGMNSFYFKCINTVFIPMILLFELKRTAGNINFIYVENLKDIYYILSLVFMSLVVWRNMTTEKLRFATELDHNLALSPFILYFLITDVFSVNLLVAIVFSSFILYEYKNYTKNKVESRIVANFLYLSPLNPLFYWIMYSVNASSIETRGKVSIVLLILVSWFIFYIKKNKPEIWEVKKSKHFKHYLILLLLTSVVYLYEKI